MLQCVCVCVCVFVCVWQMKPFTIHLLRDMQNSQDLYLNRLFVDECLCYYIFFVTQLYKCGKKG